MSKEKTDSAESMDDAKPKKKGTRPKKKAAQKQARVKPEPSPKVVASEGQEFPEFEDTAKKDQAPSADQPQEKEKSSQKKRSGRRRKKNSSNQDGSKSDSSNPQDKTEAKKDGGTSHNRNHNRTKHDRKEVAKMAWKIYLAEISEEGVALVDDQHARELSKRCFRLAEIFLDEQSRSS